MNTSSTGANVPESGLHVRNVNRRLGRATIRQLVLDYKSGLHTTQLMTKYGISKSSVLRLLKGNNVIMRRQGVSPEQAAAARVLYEEGKSLSMVARELSLPKQSIRLALLALGVVMRPGGGQATSAVDPPVDWDSSRMPENPRINTSAPQSPR